MRRETPVVAAVIEERPARRPRPRRSHAADEDDVVGDPNAAEQRAVEVAERAGHDGRDPATADEVRERLEELRRARGRREPGQLDLLVGEEADAEAERRRDRVGARTLGPE